MCIKALRVLTQHATHSGTRCNARQRARNATQNNVTAVVVCCLKIKQVRTTGLPIWEWVERKFVQCLLRLYKNKTDIYTE